MYITVSHKTAEEMAEQYGFDEEQKSSLPSFWPRKTAACGSAVLYGIYTEDGAIVSVALSQVGERGRRAVLELVWFFQPCGMVRVFCELVRQRVWLY